jgi:hypothetical protein
MKNIFLLMLFIRCTTASGQDKIELKKAANHPIRYYISLPANWSPEKTWPVIVAIEAAEKEFKLNAERFVEARGDLPFIIVSPVITTNGNHGQHDPKIYPYSIADWKFIDSVSTCEFDTKGMAAIINDIKSLYHGEDKIYITGYEAGAHLVWTMILRFPEKLNAAAPVASNFQSRCVEEKSISNDPSGIHLPVRGITGYNDMYFGAKGPYYNQYENAKALATSHGFDNISEIRVAGKDHVPLPADVMDWFASLLKESK